MEAYLLFFIFLIFFGLMPARAEAYLDPGSGSMIIQILVASILGLLFTVRRHIKIFFKAVGKIFSRKG